MTFMTLQEGFLYWYRMSSNQYRLNSFSPGVVGARLLTYVLTFTISFDKIQFNQF
jgi:hypothetical protein